MKIVIAPDSFKGSLSAKAAAAAIERGIKKADDAVRTVNMPMADGGEGTLDCLIQATSGTFVSCPVLDPLGREISSGYGILGDGKTCVIEMAMASGLYLIGEHERNPMLTTTYGFGQLIVSALDHGCRQFILALGGSATNDGGAGMLQALGVELLDHAGKAIGFGGGALSELSTIRIDGMDARLKECEFLIACDVDNPYIGEKGASVVFGPQKGATSEMVAQLDRNLELFADVIRQTLGISIHHQPGAGAAGGLAGAIKAILQGKLKSGVAIVSRFTRLEEAIAGADLVITGEGRIDSQTAGGKTLSGIARLAQGHGVPVIVLAGSIGDGIEVLYKHGITAIFSIVNRPMKLGEAMAATEGLLEEAAEQVLRTILYT
ncbi:glycerate kinase [Paenibacillus sp. J5C_2022]|uniref:glycerate kinase n=1 Tax=Paenibacillus sp. J5C2022 TaxID=2977129 RepID=UPI0021CEF06D|nr:glycerate kinase [Paenibacillus sp. J5C2022]MCU6707945.1 glycerate kinase [Paenibacillus sp. J5C2022]